MKQQIFKGVATALITPMNGDGSVNYKRLETLVDEQIKAGIDALSLQCIRAHAQFIFNICRNGLSVDYLCHRYHLSNSDQIFPLREMLPRTPLIKPVALSPEYSPARVSASLTTAAAGISLAHSS